MRAEKSAYVAYLTFHTSTYVTSPWRAELTQEQAKNLAATLEAQKKKGRLRDYYLGPPRVAEQVQANILNAKSLKVELMDMIDLENRGE